MWVGEGTNAKEIELVLNQATGDLRVRTTHIDEFHKDGRTSFAFRLVFQSKEKTLTDGEVNNIMDIIYEAVAQEGWEVR
jgi:phenylalanyl-tRNA synthetase beta subunit